MLRDAFVLCYFNKKRGLTVDSFLFTPISFLERGEVFDSLETAYDRILEEGFRKTPPYSKGYVNSISIFVSGSIFDLSPFSHPTFLFSYIGGKDRRNFYANKVLDFWWFNLSFKYLLFFDEAFADSLYSLYLGFINGETVRSFFLERFWSDCQSFLNIFRSIDSYTLDLYKEYSCLIDNAFSQILSAVLLDSKSTYVGMLSSWISKYLFSLPLSDLEGLSRSLETLAKNLNVLITIQEMRLNTKYRFKAILQKLARTE